MKLSGLTIVAPRLPSRRATYAPANPPPTTRVPPRACRRSTADMLLETAWPLSTYWTVMDLWRGTTRTRLPRQTGISTGACAPHDAAKTLSSAWALPAGRGGAARYADA